MQSCLVEWLGGFVSADGGFDVGVQRNSDTRLGFRLKPIVKIHQNCSTPAFAGFFDGDGTILYSVNKDGDGLHCEVQLNLSYAQKTLLEFIQEFLSSHNISSKIYGPYSERRVCRLSIHGLEDIEKFLRLVFPHLLGPKKLQAYIMLEEVLPRMNKRMHLYKRGFLEVMAFVDAINDLKGNVRGKYNQDYFRKLWKNGKNTDSQTL